MSVTRESLASAQDQAREARTRLAETAAQIKARLQPKVLMQEGVDMLRERRDQLRNEAIGAAQRQPAVAGAIGASILLFLLRKPLGRLLRRLFSKRDETAGPVAG